MKRRIIDDVLDVMEGRIKFLKGKIRAADARKVNYYKHEAAALRWALDIVAVHPRAL